jgi:hypothetical protein
MSSFFQTAFVSGHNLQPDFEISSARQSGRTKKATAKTILPNFIAILVTIDFVSPDTSYCRKIAERETIP